MDSEFLLHYRKDLQPDLTKPLLHSLLHQSHSDILHTFALLSISLAVSVSLQY